MKKIYLIILLAAGTVVYSQPTLFFHSRFGLNEDDNGNAIIQTLDTNYFVVGQSNSFGESQTDIYISKLNRKGLPFWQRNLGGFLLDVGKSVVELNDSSFVIAGYTNSFGAGGYDAYIVKVDKNGNVIWQKTFGGGDWDFAYSINKTTDGNLIICGATYSFGRGNKDGLILKMDYNGNILWNKIYGGAEEDDLREIIQTSDGGYIAVGTTKSYGDNLGDIWITKFDASGDSTWFKTIGGNKKDVGTSITQDKHSDYFIGGGSESYSNGMEDAYVVKLANNGSFLRHQWEGIANQNEEITSIKNSISISDGIVFCFSTAEVAGFKIDTKTLLFDSLGYYVNGGRVGSVEDEEAYCVANCFDRGYVIVGYSQGFNALQKDIFVVKFDSLMNGPGNLFVGLNSINEDTQPNLKVYPNPFVDKIFINSKDEDFLNSLEVFDLYGKKVFEKNDLNSEIIEIDNLNLISGFYIFKINTKSRTYFKKVFCKK